MQLKITRDFANGGLHQVKYYQDRPGYPKVWFDYGNPFHSRKMAKEFVAKLLNDLSENHNDREVCGTQKDL
jgi:hypothetical protein